MKFNFKFMQGGQMFAAVCVMVFVVIILAAANPGVFSSLLPQDAKSTMSQLPVYAPMTVNTPISVMFTYELTKDQFVHGHHQLVCNKQGLACNFGIYDASNETFAMGMEKSVVSYDEQTMTVFPHISEGNLAVGKIYAECSLSTYTLYVNGVAVSGCFEGTFIGVDNNGYHFLVNGQIWSLPHTHGAFLTAHSQ